MCLSILVLICEKFILPAALTPLLDIARAVAMTFIRRKGLNNLMHNDTYSEWNIDSEFQNAMHPHDTVALNYYSDLAWLISDLQEDEQDGALMVVLAWKIWKLICLSKVYRWYGKTAEQTKV